MNRVKPADCRSQQKVCLFCPRVVTGQSVTRCCAPNHMPTIPQTKHKPPRLTWPFIIKSSTSRGLSLLFSTVPSAFAPTRHSPSVKQTTNINFPRENYSIIKYHVKILQYATMIINNLASSVGVVSETYMLVPHYQYLSNSPLEKILQFGILYKGMEHWCVSKRQRLNSCWKCV